jgi:hypothetical protein
VPASPATKAGRKQIPMTNARFHFFFYGFFLPLAERVDRRA